MRWRLQGDTIILLLFFISPLSIGVVTTENGTREQEQTMIDTPGPQPEAD
jgi:hypothetical protein